MSDVFDKEVKPAQEEAEAPVVPATVADVNDEEEASEDWSVTVKMFDDEDDEEEESEKEELFQSSRVAAAAFHSRTEDEELRRQRAEAAVREGNARAKEQARRNLLRWVGSIAAGVVLLGLVWAGVEYRINKANRAEVPDISFYYRRKSNDFVNNRFDA